VETIQKGHHFAFGQPLISSNGDIPHLENVQRRNRRRRPLGGIRDERTSRHCDKQPPAGAEPTALPRRLFTITDMDKLGLPAEAPIDWSQPPTVPAAVSESAITMGRMNDSQAFQWADQQPYVRVGKSIRVYAVTSR